MLFYRKLAKLNPGLVVSQPFTAMGLALVATSPLPIAYQLVTLDTFTANLLATGLAILVHIHVALYTVKKSYNVFTEG